MKRILSVLLAAALISSLSACSSAGGSASSSAGNATSEGGSSGGDTIKIGVSGPTSGTSAESGVAINTGMQMAIDDVNKAGGIKVDGKQKQVKAIIYDSQTNTATGLSNCQKLVSVDNVDFLWADTINSSVGIAAMEVAKNTDICVATLECVSTEISKKYVSDPASYKNFFKFEFNSEAYGNAIANSIIDLGKSGTLNAGSKKVAMIGEDSDYGHSNLGACKELLTKAGYTIVSEDYVPMDTTDFYSVLSNVKSKGSDILVSCFTSTAAGSALVKQYKENGITATPFAIYYPSQKEFTKQVGNLADGLYWTPFLLNDQDKGIQEFAEKLKAKNGDKVNLDNIQGYDMMMKVLKAMEQAGTTKGDKLSQALLSLDYKGYAGTYSFDPKTHTGKDGADFIPIKICKISNGANDVVWPAKS
jgi:branched-chain amino acid transport system substrate-binding protein